MPVLLLGICWSATAANPDSNSGIVPAAADASVWKEYAWQITVAFAVCVSQALLILYLLIQRREYQVSEKNLSETRRFRDNLIQSANTLILGFDAGGRVTLMNPAAEQTTGYAEAQLKGKNWFRSMVPVDKYEMVWNGFNRFLETGTPKLCENRILTRDGRMRTISWSHTRIEQDNRIVGAVSIGIDVTERKRAEQLLKESQDKYKEIIDSTPDIRYRTDTQGNITFISKAVEHLTGYSVKAALNLKMTDLYRFPEERKQVLALLDKNGYISDFETQLKRRDGSCWWASSSSQLFRDPSGKILGVEGIIRDITRRKTAEQKLRKNEERLRQALEGTNTGLFEWYPETNETYFSPTFFTMLGFGPDQFPHNYQTWVDLLHPDDRSRAEATIQRFLKENKNTFNHKFRMRTQDLQFRWILSQGVVHETGKEGRASRILGIHSDITEYKVAQDMLQDREMRMRAVFDQTFQFMALLSLDGRFLSLNRVALEFVKARAEDVIGRPFWKTSWWRHSTTARVKLKRALKRVAAGEYISYETSNMDHSGRVHDIDFSLRPILDKDGKVIYLCAEGKNITARKKEEKQRKSLEKQLRQAQKMEAIGTLAGGIAHDFNNILGAIIGFSDLALEDIAKGDPAHYALDQVSRAAFRARDLVKQILLFSRRVEHEMKPVRVTPLAKEVVKLLRPTLAKSIVLKACFEAENDRVMADPVQVHQILMNLSTNSAHAMGERGGTLTIRITQVRLGNYYLVNHTDLKPGNYLKLLVEDTGHGIPESVMDKIFDPFFTTKPRGEGTGLGLSVVHGIVKNHNGSIHVACVPGQGTAIQVLLPLLASEQAADTREQAVVMGGHERILLVDDEIPLIEYGRHALERLGYRMTVFSDSRAAWENFKARPDQFDMVISDKSMPGMSGIELCEKISGLAPGLPVIMYTGYGDKFSLASAKKAGVMDVLYKPVEKRKLALAVRQVFDRAVSRKTG